MSYIFVNSFKQGLDARRNKISAQQGSLVTGKNIHINRGGEIEKRKAFVSTYTLPADTFGLHGTRFGIYTFGSKTITTVPTGIIYQKLIPKTATANMTEVVSVDTYNGAPYVVARFDDGSIHHFYNGNRVTDWDSIAPKITTLAAVGQALSDLITLDPNVNSVYSTVSGVPTITITVSANNISALVTASVLNAGDSNNSMSITQIQAPSSTQPQITKITLNGSYDTASPHLDASDVWTVTVNGTPYRIMPSASGIGSYVKTFRSKMYATVQGLLYFSGTETPTTWVETIKNVLGLDEKTFAGYESPASHTGQSENLVAMAPYQNYMAIFSRRATQIWTLVAGDPVDNMPQQILDNVGTIAARSAINFGEMDVFFLSDTGIRSLRARDASNAAVVFDVGTSIDPLILKHLKTVTELVASKACGVIEPAEGRYLLAIGDKIFVYSFFPASNISAWTTYETGFSVSDWAVQANQLYCRADNIVYLYGGPTGDTYDSSLADVELSWFDADKPAHRKRFTGMDFSCEGTWNISYSTDPVKSEFVQAGSVIDQNFSLPAFGIAGYGTHIGLKISSSSPMQSKMSSAAIHFEFTDPPK